MKTFMQFLATAIVTLALFASDAIARTITGTLDTDNEASEWFLVRPGDSVTYAITPDGSESGFIGTAAFEQSTNRLFKTGLATFTGTVGTPNTTPATGSFKNSTDGNVYVRVRIDDIDTDNDSDLIDFEIADVANIAQDAALVKGVFSNRDGSPLLTFYEDGVTIPTLTVSTATITAATVQSSVIVNSGAKVGATSGWTVNGATNLGTLALLPASQTAATLVVPLTGLSVGDVVSTVALIGQIESAGGAVTIDMTIRKLTAVAADVTDAAICTLTQISVIADTAVTPTNGTCTLGTAETINGTTETLYALITATTAGSTDIVLTGLVVDVQKALQ